MSRPWSDSTKRAVAIGLALIFALVLYRFNSIIPPLTIAIIIAYILTPVVDALQRNTRMPRALSVLLVDVLALGLVAVIPAVVGPALVAEIRAVDLDTRALAEDLTEYLSGSTILLGYEVDFNLVYTQLSSVLQSVASTVVSGGVFFLIDVATWLFWLLFAFVASFYLMRDWHRITAYFYGVVPPGYRSDYAHLTARIGRTWQSFFRGQIVLSVVVGTVTGLAMAVLGVSNALALALLAGLLEVVPNVGPVLAAIPAVLLALFKGSSWLPISGFWFALLVVGTYVIIQQVENNYLVPRIIGSSVKLHPMVVIVGAIAGASIAGILGIFLAAPVIASARILLSYIYSKLQDLEPFPESEQPASVRRPDEEPPSDGRTTPTSIVRSLRRRR